MQMKYSMRLTTVFLLLCCVFSVPPAWGEDETVARVLGLDESDNSSILPTYRSPRPASLIAENVTVVTAEDIARLNAHTLDEVLQTVTGFQLFQMRTPGSAVPFSLSGAFINQVMLLIDGIPQNHLGVDDTPDLGMIPVQRIERIEIIKGAASVAWGPALGGAVNVITRNPEANSKLAGVASASYGDSSTSDLRGGVSGTTERLGYYLDGGRFNSNGLRPGNMVTLNHGIGKLTYDLPGKGRLTFATDYRDRDFNYGYNDVAAGLGDTLTPSGSRYASTYLRFDYPLNDRLNLELFSSAVRRDLWRKYVMPDNILIVDGKNRTNSEQVAAKLIWNDRRINLSLGFEYLHDNVFNSEPKLGYSYMNFTRDMSRYGAYVSGSYSIGDLTILSGVRLDHISPDEQVTSYHLGATLQLTDKTLLRAYAARGYSLPMPNMKNSLQNIFTLQTGIETSEIPYLWLKGTLFYCNTWNIQRFIVPSDYPLSNISTVETEETRQGFEIEGRTSPFYGFNLRAGFTYSDVRDKKRDVRVNNVPISSTRVALYYDNVRRGFQADISGSRVNWPSDAGNSVHDRQIVWDLHISQKLPKHGGVSSELFFTGHNLFNNAQYTDDWRVNAPRWFEGGVRVNF